MHLPVDTSIKDILNQKLSELEKHFDSDFLYYYGPILDGSEINVLRIIEEMADDPQKKDRLYIMLTTPGGSAIAVERYVNIIRKHYQEVNFIIPDYAYSAGTIFCMSGDNILMDYYSVLGPIDPQVQNKEGKLVAALGYLDKVNELVKKAKLNELTQAEFIILKDMDLAELRGYEQAKELTIDLLRNWLVKYKFKNWSTHCTTPGLLGKPVTDEEKVHRAKEIADKLSDNNTWKSHGRPINIDALENNLHLKIEDYSDNPERKGYIRSYYLLIVDYIQKNGLRSFIHTRKFI